MSPVTSTAMPPRARTSSATGLSFCGMASDQNDLLGLRREHERAGVADAPRRPNHRDRGFGDADAHLRRALLRPLDGGGDGVGVSRRDGDVHPARQRNSAVSHNRRQRAQPDDLRAQPLGHLGAPLKLRVNDFRRERQELVGRQRTADEPALGLRARLALHPDDMRGHHRRNVARDGLQHGDGRVGGHGKLTREVAANVDRVDDKGEAFHAAYCINSMTLGFQSSFFSVSR